MAGTGPLLHEVSDWAERGEIESCGTDDSEHYILRLWEPPVILLKAGMMEEYVPKYVHEYNSQTTSSRCRRLDSDIFLKLQA